MPPCERVVIVTAASKGIGNAMATLLAKRGDRVFGTSRNPAVHMRRADEFFELLSLDVTDAASVDLLFAEVLGKEGRIDALVCNAGMGMAGPFEDFSPEETELQMDVNFLGTVRCIRAVLPIMRGAGKGHIVVLASLAGRAGAPFQAVYSASKHALEGLVESLRHEVRPFGIELCLVEPGDFMTGFSVERECAACFDPLTSPYADSFREAMGIKERDEKTGAFPLEVARLVERILASRRVAVRYTVGPLYQRLGIFLKPFLPGRLFELLYRQYFRFSQSRGKTRK